MKKTLLVTSWTIIKKLKSYNYKSSILEYIENWLDAGAKNILINYKLDTIGKVEYLKIDDDGWGITYELIDDKFWVFWDSEKQKSKHSSTTSGKDWVWRLSFIAFADSAKWITTYDNPKEWLLQFEININSRDPQDLDYSIPAKWVGMNKWTQVIFSGVDETVSEHTINNDLRKYLLESLSWRLILSWASLYINGKPLNPKDLIQHEESVDIELDGFTFNLHFIKWHESPKGEESRFYFLDSSWEEKYKVPTSFNRQGDDFFHSLYIKSNYFDSFTFVEKAFYWDDVEIEENSDNGIMQLLDDPNDEFTPRDAKFRSLRKELNKWILEVRKPFIKSQAQSYIKDVEDKGILEKWSSVVDNFLYENTKEFLEELYLHSPKFLKDQTDEQKWVFIKLVYTVLSEWNTTKVFDIIDKVLDLTKGEREEFAKILQHVELSNILKTVQIVNDRLDVLRVLEQFVYNEDLSADEVHDLQVIIAKHYWLFWDEYTYISDAEPNFEEIMNRYIHLLRWFSDERKYLDDPDKLKQVDLFISKTDRYISSGIPYVKNVVVEIKHPSKNIWIEAYTQVNTYMEVIRRTPEFNTENFEWKFILIGKKHKEFIDNQLRSNAGNWNSVILKPDEKYILYYKDWSQVIEENKSRLEYLRKKLDIKHTEIFERNDISNKAEWHEILENSAVLETAS